MRGSPHPANLQECSISRISARGASQYATLIIVYLSMRLSIAGYDTTLDNVHSVVKFA